MSFILPGMIGATKLQFQNNYALDPDGVDDYINVLNHSSIQFAKTDSFSVGFWVKPDVSDARFCVAKHNDDADVFNWDIGILISSYPVFRCDSSTGGTTITGTTTVTAGWNHILATYNNGSMTLYLNGSSIGTGTYTGSTPANTAALQLAKASYNSNTANITIDEVCIWNAELDSDAATVIGTEPIDLLANNGNYDYSGNVVAYWRMEEGTGATAADSSTNSNDGSTISASPWVTDTP